MKKKLLSAILLINILMVICLSLPVGAVSSNPFDNYVVKRIDSIKGLLTDKNCTYWGIAQYIRDPTVYKLIYFYGAEAYVDFFVSQTFYHYEPRLSQILVKNVYNGDFGGNSVQYFDIGASENDFSIFVPGGYQVVAYFSDYYINFDDTTAVNNYINKFGNISQYVDDIDYTSKTTEARFTSLGDYFDVSSNDIKSFFTSNYVAKKTSTSDGTRLNFNELFGVGSYVKTSYYLPTDISIPSYFIPNKSVTNEVSFSFTNRDVNNLKIVVSRYTNVSDKVATPDTGIFSFSRSVFANYMHQYITFQPESFKDIPKDKVLHYKFDMSGLVSLISQNKTYTDYWGNTAYFYDLFGLVIDENKKAEAFVLELYGDDKLLTSATYCYTGSKRFDEPTGEPYVEFLIKDKDDGFEPTIDDDSEKIGGFDDAEKDDTVIKNPVGDYDLNFNIDDIGLAVMSSVNSTKSLFTFAWSLFPAAFMTLLLGALGLIVILRVLGR